MAEPEALPQLEQPPQPQTKFWKKVGAVGKEFGQEFKAAPPGKKAQIVGALASIAFSQTVEWGTGHEAFLAFVGFELYRRTGSWALAGAGVSVASGLEEYLFGYFAANAMEKIPRTMDAVRTQFFSKKKLSAEALPVPSVETVDLAGIEQTSLRDRITAFNDEKVKPAVSRGLDALAFGTTIMVLGKNRRQRHSFKENMDDVRYNSTAIAVGNLLLAGPILGAVQFVGDGLHHPEVADSIVSFATNPFYIAATVGTIKYGIPAAYNHLFRRGSPTASNAVPEPEPPAMPLLSNGPTVEE